MVTRGVKFLYSCLGTYDQMSNTLFIQREIRYIKVAQKASE